MSETTKAPPTAPPKSAADLAKDTKRMTMRRLFEQQRPELSKLLPRGMSIERLERMALTECTKNPQLLDCTAESWALAMQKCTAQGLYPDSELGYMYLIPRRKGKKQPGVRDVYEVHAQRGYQGDMKLWRNTGEVTRIWAEVVHAKDTYKVTKGLDPNIVHEPYDGDDDPGSLKACYAVAKHTSGDVSFVTLNKRDVLRHRAASATDLERDDNPWNAHEEAMWKKTAIHELNKWMPKASEKAEEAARAIADDNRPKQPVIDIESVSVPLEEAPKTQLDKVKEELRQRSAGAPPATDQPPAPEEEPPPPATDKPADQPPACEHVTIPQQRVAALKPGQTIACADCGHEFTGAAREPGEDDVETDPAAAPDSAVASGAPPSATEKKDPPKKGQRKLEEA